MLTFPNTSTHHNVFELHHRFIGWLGLAVRDDLVVHSEHWADLEWQATWFFVVLGSTYDIKTRTWRVDVEQLISSQEFWLVLGMTVLYAHGLFSYIWILTLCGSVLIPWFTVREVPVDVEIVSQLRD